MSETDPKRKRKRSRREGKSASESSFPELDPEFFEMPDSPDETGVADAAETFRRETDRIQRETDRLRDPLIDTATELEPEIIEEPLAESAVKDARTDKPAAKPSGMARAPGWEQTAYRKHDPNATRPPEAIPGGVRRSSGLANLAATGAPGAPAKKDAHTTEVPEAEPVVPQSGQVSKRSGQDFPAVNEAAKELARAALAAEIEKEEKRALANYKPEEGEIPPSPEVAKRFDVILQLGKGGMAVVYLCRDPRSGGKVFAVKDIRAEMKPGMKVEQRVEHEAKLLKDLDHPGIVKVFDLMKFNRGSAIVMEYVDGLPLDHEIGAGRRINWEFAVRVLREIGAALQYAHDHGVIHRDIKPDNILWSERRSQMKLVDFGLARIYGEDADTHMTRTGMVVGTPHYMSPEQVSGKPLDRRSDEYSFGATLYYLLTGQRHVEGSNVMDILEQQRSKEIIPPSHLQRDIPAWVSYIIGKMMEIRPDDRYMDMNAVLRDLDDAEKDPEDFVARLPRGRVKRYGNRELTLPVEDDAYFGAVADYTTKVPPDPRTTGQRKLRRSTFRLDQPPGEPASTLHDVVSTADLGTQQISALLMDISTRLDKAEKRAASTNTTVVVFGLVALIVVLLILGGLLWAAREGYLGPILGTG